MKKTIALSTLVFLATPVEATNPQPRKFALVVGGATEKSVENATKQSETPPDGKRISHEFAQSTARVAYGLKQSGYEVTTLFDSAGMTPAPGSGASNLQNTFDEDYAQLRSMGAQRASSISIVSALNAIAAKANPGDVLEFTLFAHGYRSCKRADGSMDLGVEGLSLDQDKRANSNDDCEHIMSLTNPTTGAIEKVPTRVLSEALKAVERAGVKTNLNLASCHSGEAQDLFSAEEFPNTCVSYLASANNVGFGCFPGDAAGDLSYTSTLDMVMASNYIQFADQMMQNNYFKKDDCLSKITNYYRSKNVEPATNRYELFMNARRNDRMPHEPSISSQASFEYFTEGRFNAVASRLVKGSSGELCFSPIQRDILAFLEFGGDAVTELGRSGIQRLLQTMQTDMNAYNQSLRVQKEIKARIDAKPVVSIGAPGLDTSSINFDFADQAKPSTGPTGSQQAPPISEKPQAFALDQASPDAQQGAQTAIDPALNQELKNAQDRTMELANIVMDSERAIVDIMDQQVLRSRIPAEDPCLRSDPRPRVAAGAQ